MVDQAGKTNASAALRLLHGIAAELRDLAEDTARFGENLSSDTSIAGTNRAIGLLQRFDIFSQSLQAHALLIGDLSNHIAADADDVSALHDLIGQIPFFSMRERLRAQLSGAAEIADEVPDDSKDEHWF